MSIQNKVNNPFTQAFLFLSACLILIISLNLVSKRTLLPPKAESAYIPPVQVKVVNQYDQGFTVTWLTKDKTKGYVVYGEDKSQIEKNEINTPKISDKRGDNEYFTHFIEVRNLSPDKIYYYKIISGERTYYYSIDAEWREAGVADTVNLPTNPGNTPGAFSLEENASSGCQQYGQNQLASCYRPNLFWGKLSEPDSHDSTDGLVYLDIPGKSNIVAAYVDNQGKWVLNLANLWQSDFSNYISYQPGIDLVRLTGTSGNTKITQYQSIKKVASSNSNELNAPINLKLQSVPIVLPQNTPTPTTTVTATNPTATPTVTPQPAAPLNVLTFKIRFPAKNIKILPVKVELKDLRGKWVNLKVSLTNIGNNDYQGSLNFARPDEYYISIKPDGYLKTNLGKFRLASQQQTIDFRQSSGNSWVGGDVNNDEKINSLDLGLLFGKYLKNANPVESVDLNGDSRIDVLDLSILLEGYTKFRL